MLFVLRRILSAIPTFLMVVTLIFFVVRLVPGGPAVAVLGEQASEAAVESLRERMGLNDPIWVQYWDFLSGLARADLGSSLITSRPIGEEIADVLPHTVQLATCSILIGVVVGVPLGIATASRQNSWIDYAGRIASLAGISFPPFFLAIVVIYLFAVLVPLFPTYGAGDLHDPVSVLWHLALPALSLGLIAMGYITRVTRSVVLNTLGEDFVRTAKAKGAGPLRVLLLHAFRPAVLPVVSLVGLFVVTLFGGTVLTEIVFSRPGLGSMMVNATIRRDYTTLQACMVVFTVLVIVINMMTDLLYGMLDPQIRRRR